MEVTVPKRESHRLGDIIAYWLVMKVVSPIGYIGMRILPYAGRYANCQCHKCNGGD